MYDFIQAYGAIPAIALQALLISRFFNRSARDYPIGIVYSIVLICLTLGAILFQSWREFVKFLPYLSLAEIIMHILLLCLMLQLTYQTLEQLSLPVSRVWGLVVLSFVVLVGSYLIFEGKPAQVFVKIRQVFSFWMVLLNLHWWTLLLRKRIQSRRVLLLSAGIGLQMTGQVISDGLYALPGAGTKTILAGYIVALGTHLASLYSWFVAFSPENAPREVSKNPSQAVEA